MPNAMHRRPERERLERAAAVRDPRGARCPGLDRLRLARRRGSRSGRTSGEQLTARGNPAARDLVRHAFADVGGNANRARAWARAARRWPTGAQSDLLDAYRLIEAPTLLLWADEDRAAPARDRRGGARPAPRRAAARARRAPAS